MIKRDAASIDSFLVLFWPIGSPAPTFWCHTQKADLPCHEVHINQVQSIQRSPTCRSKSRHISISNQCSRLQQSLASWLTPPVPGTSASSSRLSSHVHDHIIVSTRRTRKRESSVLSPGSRLCRSSYQGLPRLSSTVSLRPSSTASRVRLRRQSRSQHLLLLVKCDSALSTSVNTPCN